MSTVLTFPFKCPMCECKTLHFPSSEPGHGKEIYLCPSCKKVYEVHAGTGEVVVNERIG